MVIAVDTNLLVHAHRRESRRRPGGRDPCRTWPEAQLTRDRDFSLFSELRTRDPIR